MRFFFFILLFPALLSAAGFPSFKWEKGKERDGLRAWRSTPTNGSPAFRIEGIVDAPLERVLSVLLNAGDRTTWAEGCLESRDLKEVPRGGTLRYERWKLIPLFSKRDLVSEVRVSTDPRSRTVLLRSLPAGDPGAPPLKGHVRGELWLEFQVQPMTIEGQSYVRLTMRFDPKGRIPGWLAEPWMERWMGKSFGKLREISRDQDRKIPTQAKELVKELKRDN